MSLVKSSGELRPLPQDKKRIWGNNDFTRNAGSLLYTVKESSRGPYNFPS
jgi:hypothetical protein